jgi:phosphatidylglycerophosphate synthase
LLDFCDGTVARMANKVSKSAFRYDHLSDLFKISLVILGVGIRYNETLIWVMAFSACFVFMYGDALNREVHIAINRQASIEDVNKSGPNVRLRDRHFIAAWVVKHDILLAFIKNAYAAFLTVNGHTLLLFFLFPFGTKFAIWGLSYLIFVELWTIRFRIALLVVMRR